MWDSGLVQPRLTDERLQRALAVLGFDLVEAEVFDGEPGGGRSRGTFFSRYAVRQQHALPRVRRSLGVAASPV